VTTDRRILFQGELQLMRWSESSNTGATVTFWVHPEDLESFKLLRVRAGKQVGQRIGTVMVEIGDDEAIVEQPAPTPAPTTAPGAVRYQKPSIGAMGMLAVRWCKDLEFQRWVADQLGDSNERASEADCKQFILMESGVVEKYDPASRKHLDADPACGEAFQANVRGPFMRHLAARGVIR
jgi:hypothetical protein